MTVSLEQMKFAVEKWKSNMSDLSVQFQGQLAFDSLKGFKELLYIFNTLRSLDHRVSLNDAGSVSQKLYICLEGFPAGFEDVYFGYADDKVLLTQAQIEAGEDVKIVSGGAVVVPYDTGSNSLNYKFLWFATKKTQPIKNHWEDLSNKFNQGGIGGEDNLFASPVEVGDYYFYITNYSTIYHGIDVVNGMLMTTKTT